MKTNYWQRERRKRKIENGLIDIISTSKMIEFKYKENSYKYSFISNSNAGFAYIYNSIGQKIYGPYDGDCTDEGKEVYEQFTKQKSK